MKKLLIFFIKTYQFLISPLLASLCGCKCRFTPTCSCYMIEAIEKKGLKKGFILGINRLLKCNPFCKKTGFDPVE